ncbi:LytR/AlgR family response regulator transcription factor [Roseivirga sp.]|uniref:LytR/AlgR family response regulator transcription factor n=1 Tax=Roseivirga sp. TaxID=1964215 RepID=UPI003B525DBB
MPEIRVFVVEDELIHAENTKLSIEEAGFVVAGECDHGDMALEEILKSSPDVVLMDISLPGKNNGITIAKKLSEQKGPPVIFTTSFRDSETMAEAAEVSPVSYLVKPVQTDNLKAAVTLALSKRPNEAPKFADRSNDESVFIKSGNKLQKILLKDILWIEAAGDNYCKIVTPGHQLVSRHTVKAMVNELNSDLFIQTHRAYVVNRSKIDSIHEKEQLVIINGHEIPLGRSYKEELYSSLKRY